MDAALALAPIGHNSIPARDLIAEDPAIVYREPDVLAEALAEFRAEITSAEIDLSNTEGRDAIKSRSAAFSRLKVKIEDAGKALTEDWRKKTAEVNAVKSKASAEFDKLRDDARKPLTEWETAKKKRDDEIAALLAKIDAMATVPADLTAQGVKDRIDWLECLAVTEDVFGAFQPIAAGKRHQVMETLTAALSRIEQAEKDRAELDKLRAAQAERDRVAQAEADRIAADKAEQDRIASAAAKAIDDERRRAQAEIDAANERAAEIERKADQDRRDREANDKIIAAEAAAQKAADEARAANQKHRAKIMGDAKRALMDHTGANEEHAKCIVLAIVAGSIPHTSLKF